MIRMKVYNDVKYVCRLRTTAYHLCPMSIGCAWITSSVRCEVCRQPLASKTSPGNNAFTAFTHLFIVLTRDFVNVVYFCILIFAVNSS